MEKGNLASVEEKDSKKHKLCITVQSKFKGNRMNLAKQDSDP